MRNPSDKQNQPVSDGAISRRECLKLAGVTGTAALVPVREASANGGALEGKRLAMVIDLQRCTGCGGCVVSCKSENNVQTGVRWAKTIVETIGKFPDVRLNFIPTLCNHCDKAPCVRACPTGAMHKDDGGITAHNPVKCIGCKTCKAMCPYDVVTLNKTHPHRFWKGKEAAITGCTSSGEEVVKKVKATGIPYYNKDKDSLYPGGGLRYKGIAEKCTFCDHRLKDGKMPHCVVSCPAKARIVGDLNDPNSEVRRLLGKYRPWRLKEHLGTEPKVFYIRSFNPAANRGGAGRI